MGAGGDMWRSVPIDQVYSAGDDWSSMFVLTHRRIKGFVSWPSHAACVIVAPQNDHSGFGGCYLRLLRQNCDDLTFFPQDTDKDMKLRLVAANSTAKLCDVFDLGEFYNGIEHVPYANTLNYHKNIDLS